MGLIPSGIQRKKMMSTAMISAHPSSLSLSLFLSLSLTKVVARVDKAISLAPEAASPQHDVDEQHNGHCNDDGDQYHAHDNSHNEAEI